MSARHVNAKWTQKFCGLQYEYSSLYSSFHNSNGTIVIGFWSIVCQWMSISSKIPTYFWWIDAPPWASICININFFHLIYTLSTLKNLTYQFNLAPKDLPHLIFFLLWKINLPTLYNISNNYQYNRTEKSLFILFYCVYFY